MPSGTCVSGHIGIADGHVQRHVYRPASTLLDPSTRALQWRPWRMNRQVGHGVQTQKNVGWRGLQVYSVEVDTVWHYTGIADGMPIAWV